MNNKGQSSRLSPIMFNNKDYRYSMNEKSIGKKLDKHKTLLNYDIKLNNFKNGRTIGKSMKSISPN